MGTWRKVFSKTLLLICMHIITSIKQFWDTRNFSFNFNSLLCGDWVRKRVETFALNTWKFESLELSDLQTQLLLLFLGGACGPHPKVFRGYFCLSSQKSLLAALSDHKVCQGWNLGWPHAWQMPCNCVITWPQMLFLVYIPQTLLGRPLN